MDKKKLKIARNKIIKQLSSPTSAINNIDILIILSKSKDILKISPKTLKRLNKKLIIIDPNYFCNHFQYYGNLLPQFS